MMEASAAGLDTTDATQNGIVTAVGIYAAGELVELIDREPGQLRPDLGGTVRGRRTVDEDGAVGFAGLEVGFLYWLRGYSAGQPLNVRCIGLDPGVSLVSFQTPVAPLAVLVGIGEGQSSVSEPPAAEPELAPEGSGVDPAATAAIEDPPPANLPPADADASPAPDPSPDPTSQEGDGSGADQLPVPDATPPATDAPAPVPAAAEPDTPSAEPGNGTPATPADAPASDPAAGIESAVDAGPAADTSSAPDASVDTSPGDLAPEASAPESTVVEGATTVADLATDAATEAANQAKVEAAPDAASVQAQAADPTPWDQPVQQAEGLSVENARSLSDAELRQAITEKGATPVV